VSVVGAYAKVEELAQRVEIDGLVRVPQLVCG
jgi:hypothetical protein